MGCLTSASCFLYHKQLFESMFPDDDVRRFNENVNYTFFGVKRVAVVTSTNFTWGQKKYLISARKKSRRHFVLLFFFVRKKKSRILNGLFRWYKVKKSHKELLISSTTLTSLIHNSTKYKTFPRAENKSISPCLVFAKQRKTTMCSLVHFDKGEKICIKYSQVTHSRSRQLYFSKCVLAFYFSKHCIVSSNIHWISSSIIYRSVWRSPVFSNEIPSRC